MNPKVKELWLAALRSGKYLRGKNKLRQSIGGTHYYCPLGVLCDLYSNADWSDSRHLGWGVIPPPEVTDWAGVDRLFKIAHPKAQTIIGANDRADLSFEETADIIEEQW